MKGGVGVFMPFLTMVPSRTVVSKVTVFAILKTIVDCD